MSKQYLNPESLFDSVQYGFSQGVVSSGGRTIYLSGQVAWDAEQKISGGDDLEAQAMQSLRNVDTALRAADSSIADVVSLRIYIVQRKMNDTSGIGRALKAFFPAGRAPAATWIGVPSLANEAFLVEFEAIAVSE